MDLNTIQRRERIKNYTSVVFITVSMISLMIFWSLEERSPIDEISQCLNVVNDEQSYHDQDVSYCKWLINEIIKRKNTVTT